LVHEPEILLLDEPTLGVDVQSRNAIHEYIRTIPATGKTVVLTTNYMEEAQKLASRILILDTRVVEGPATLQEIHEKHASGNVVEIQTINDQEVRDAVMRIVDQKLKGKLLSSRVEGGVLAFQVLLREERVETTLRKMLDTCRDANIPVDGLSAKKPNLEDIFLQITGKKLRD